MKILRKIFRELLLKRRCEERYVLERKIFPKIKNKKILWVGCAHYTADYIGKMLRNKNQVYTIDILPEAKQFGSANHKIGSIADADKFYEKDFFDIVFMTGVFGYGLNEEKESERALKSCNKILKKGGLLIIYWADREGRNNIIPEKLKGYNLFERVNFGSYPSGYKTKKNVVLEFLRKT